jgi:phosphohistidine phosphatase
MKHLILLRHASAADGAPDRERPLLDRGRRDAERVGRALAARGPRPEHALVSPARRAQETLRAVAEALGGLAVSEEDESLYLAGRGVLLERLRRAPESAAGLLLVGHNPGLSELVAWLAPGRSEREVRAFARGLAPGACAILGVPRGRWSELAPGDAEWIALLDPAELA